MQPARNSVRLENLETVLHFGQQDVGDALQEQEVLVDGLCLQPGSFGHSTPRFAVFLLQAFPAASLTLPSPSPGAFCDFNAATRRRRRRAATCHRS